MAEQLNNNLEKYFQAARKEPLVASFEETRLNFKINAVSSHATMWDQFKSFFSQKINIIYTVIGTSLVTSLLLVDFNMNDKKIEEQSEVINTPFEAKQSQAIQPVTADFTPDSEEAMMVVDQESADTGQPKEKVAAQPLEVQVKETEKKEITEPKKQPEKPESPAPKEEQIKEEAEKKNPPVREKPKPATKVKPPFKYTFSPLAQEAELKKLQEDLKKDNIILTFTKLKYKDGVIDKIEGSISLEGYYATFYTDEFDDFTFVWSYSKYKGNTPEKFDIIINSPMMKKSNTSIHIDEIE